MGNSFRTLGRFSALILIFFVLGIGNAIAGGTAEKEEIKTLEMFWFADGVETQVMKKLIEQYEGLTPGIKIELIEVPFEDALNKIMMSVSGGEPPALARTTEGLLSNINEATINLKDYVADGDAFLDQFLPAIQNYFVINGKMCAAPTDVTANGLIYNKTAFDQAGVSVPQSPDNIWTWEEFDAALKKVVANSDVRYGFVIDNPTHRWSTMLYEFGGRFVDQYGPAFNSPESIAAVNFTKKMFDDGVIPKSTWLGGENPNNLFRSGQVAAHLSGSWILANYRDNITDFEWGVTYLPKEMYRSSVPGGKQIAAFKGSGVEQEAADFIAWVTGQEANAQFCEDSLFLSPRLDNANLEYSFGKEYFSIFANELANTVPAASFDWGYPGLIASIRTALIDGMKAVISGDTSTEDFVQEVDEAASSIF